MGERAMNDGTVPGAFETEGGKAYLAALERNGMSDVMRAAVERVKAADARAAVEVPVSDETPQAKPSELMREQAIQAAAMALAEYVGEPGFAPDGQPMYGPHAKVMVDAVLALFNPPTGQKGYTFDEERMPPRVLDPYPRTAQNGPTHERLAYFTPWVAIARPMPRVSAEGTATE